MGAERRRARGVERCYICMTRMPETLYTSCNHTGGCLPCTMNSLKDRRSCQICRKQVEGDILIFEAKKEGQLVSEQKMNFIYKEKAPMFLSGLFREEGRRIMSEDEDGDNSIPRERRTPLILRFR